MLFDNPPTQVGDSKSFTTTSPFGFYVANGDGTDYSEKSLNADGYKHARLFMLKGDGKDGCYALAFEDTKDGGDQDYQDIILEICGLNLIPEFPTIALPVAAILGLAFVFMRKEE